MHDAAAFVNVFDYVDFREFLAAYYLARKSREPKFTHRYISAHVRTGSAGWFSDILKGRTNLSDNHLVLLVRLMCLKSTEAEYFELLVRYSQAGSTDEKSLHYMKLLSLKGVKTDLIGAEQFEFYSEWYHSAIRELLLFHPFRGDFAGLGKKLNPAISAADAKKSILLLEKLGFIKKTASKGYASVDATLKKDSNFKSIHLAHFLKSNCALGTESIDRIPKEERDISAMTISLSRNGFLKAKEEIRALRERILALAKTDENPDKVFQCNFHMFPITR